jgi:transposase
VVFVDESGLLLSPLVRRTWSPCGQRPVLLHSLGHHQKLSVIAALSVRTDRRQVRLCFRLHDGGSIDGARVVAFLRQLGAQSAGMLLVIWDRLKAHRGKAVERFAAAHPRFHFELLPPYAPELNPVEYAWSWLKTNPLANAAPHDVAELTHEARHHARKLQHRPRLLWSFIEHSPLSLRPK